MFWKKKKKEKENKDKVKFETENYIMPEYFDVSKLVVANLESISNETELPTVSTTDQKYIFEKINDNDRTRYKEVFTGFITDIEDNCHYFNYPYLVNIVSLKEALPTIRDSVPKFSLLLIEVNTKLEKVIDKEVEEEKKDKNDVCVIFKDEDEEKQFSEIASDINQGKDPCKRKVMKNNY